MGCFKFSCVPREEVESCKRAKLQGRSSGLVVDPLQEFYRPQEAGTKGTSTAGPGH